MALEINMPGHEPKPPANFGFNGSFPAQGPSGQKPDRLFPTADDDSGKRSRSISYRTLRSNASNPVPLSPAEYERIVFAGPTIIQLSRPLAQSGSIAGVEFHTLFAAPNEPPPTSGNAWATPIRGYGGRILIPSAGTWYVALASGVNRMVDVQFIDCPSMEFALWLMNRPLAGNRGNGTLAVAAATDTLLVDASLEPITRYFQFTNVGANPVNVSVGFEADATTGILVAAGATYTADEHTYDSESVHLFSTAGTSVRYRVGGG